MDLSVVICAYNRDYFLEKLVNSLMDQTYDKDLYEIIIIDNNSTDNTADIANKLINNNPVSIIRYYLETNQGLSFARNRGIRESVGRFIAFIDDDAYTTKHYIHNICYAFNLNDNFSAAGGKVIPVFESGKEPDWLSKYIEGVLAKVDMGNSITKFSKKFPVGCNMIFRRELLEEIGGFNDAITFRSDEKYVFRRVKKLKKTIMYFPDIIVYHNIESKRTSREGVVKICKSIGRSELNMLKSERNYTEIVVKFFEYIFKLFASFIIGLNFLLAGEYNKAKYLIKVRLYILVGYFNW